jgi:hypothetical protein
MRLPEGRREPEKVAKLHKCLYGLKQSPREWYSRLADYLRTQGYIPSHFDPCVFVLTTGIQYIAVYVDDITIYGPANSTMDSIKRALKSEFQVTDLGDVHWLLGIQIEIDNLAISLSQTAYIDTVLSRFQMEQCHPVNLPIDPNAKLSKYEGTNDPSRTKLYQQIVGSLMYCVTGTRPDLAFVVTFLSRFSNNPSSQHLQAVKRVLRYLKGTRTLKLRYPKFQPLSLVGYTDADYANCVDTRRSISGYIFKFGNSTIAWRSQKQKSVATSTTEAEYMALSLCRKQLVWLQGALKELKMSSDIPTAIMCDNQSTIEIANDAKISD